jgi:hypothetical protein
MGSGNIKHRCINVLAALNLHDAKPLRLLLYSIFKSIDFPDRMRIRRRTVNHDHICKIQGTVVIGVTWLHHL